MTSNTYDESNTSGILFDGAEGLRNKTVMVTGATGLIGRTLIGYLMMLNRQHQFATRVVAVARDRQKAESLLGKENDMLTIHCHDFSQPSELALEQKVDYIIHLASPTASRFFLEHPAATLLTTLHGTEAVLNYARHRQVEGMVYVSSLEAYGQVTDDSQPLTEDIQGYVNPIDSRSSYPTAKRAAEALCHAYAAEHGVRVCIARLAQTFGEGVAADDQRVFAQFARSAVNHTDIVLHTKGELCRCYCHTTDAAEALLLLAMRGAAGEAYNVAHPDSYISIIDMARMVCREFAPDTKVVVVPKEGMGYSPTTKLRLDTTKMEALGWKPLTPLREMFRLLIESFRKA